MGHESSTGDFPLNTTDLMASSLSSALTGALAFEDFDFFVSFFAFGAGTAAWVLASCSAVKIQF